MPRTPLLVSLFAVAVVLVVAAASWLAYRGVRRAVEAEFAERLERVAATAAHEISAGDVRDARLRDEAAYGALQVQLVTLRSATGVANASLVDRDRVTLVDAREGEVAEGLHSALDSLAGRALATALAGDTVLSAPYRGPGGVLRAAFAPVRDSSGAVAAVVAVETTPAYLPAVADLGRTLLLIAAVTLLAILLLAAVVVRGALSAARLERRLSRAENLAAMGRLTATLAHEIKNPLAVIRGSVQRLGRLDPEAERMAGYVTEETDRLSHTVERYLRFARGEEGAGEHGDAVAALGATLALLEGECRARRVTLETSAPFPAPAPVALDNDSLKQLYLNLLLNALEAMPEGGRLSVRVAEAHGRIEVAIGDDGPGIPREIRARLGEPFVTTKATGSGLGLFLAQRLAKAAGGSLEIAAGEGRGTTCIVRMPKRRERR